MNADLLQNFYTGLETLMRERRQLLARRVLAVEAKVSPAAVPLTPALSLGERENRTPVGPQSDALQSLPVLLSKLPEPGGKASALLNCGAHALLFPLPQREGQGEGKAALQQSKPARKPESLPL